MHLKSILTLLTALSLISGAAAQIQHHPFSQLFPADQNLPFDGKNLTGATQLETASIIANSTDGNITFRDSTGGKTLIWNSNAVRWEVVNSDLDLNDNSIENYFAGQCGSGKVVDQINADGSYTCVSVSAEAGGTEGLNATLAAGDIVNTTLYFNGNTIDSPGSIDSYFSGDCGSGKVVDSINADGSYNCVSISAETGGAENLNKTLLAGNIANNTILMNGNDIDNPGQVDGVEIDNPGNAIQVSGNQYVIPSGAISDDEVSDNSLTNSSIALNSFTMTTLDLTSNLQGSNIVNSGQINSGAVGSSELATDAVNNDSIDNTATVMINGATITSSLDTNQNNLEDVANIYSDDSSTNFFGSCSGGQVIESISSDGSISCIDPAEDLQTEGLNETLLAGDIANQSIRMNGNSLVMGNYRLTDDGQGIQIGNGTTSTGDSDQIAIGKGSSVSSSGSLAIGHESSAFNVNTIAVGEGSDADRPGAIALGDNTESSAFDTVAIGTGSKASASDAIAIGHDSSASGTGSVAIGYSAKSPNDDEVTMGNLESEQRSLNVTGNTTIHGVGGIDLQGNDLTDVSRIEGDDSDGNFFGSQCGSGQVVDAINADGSYTCVSVSAESGGSEGLNDTLAVGDIANTTIYMNGNDIDNPGQVDGVEIENPGNAIEVSSNQYAVSSDSIGNSEIANSESITVSGLTSNAAVDLNNNAVNEVGSGATNITSTGKIEAGGNIDAGGNNLNNVNSIDNGGSSVQVDDNVDLNGNSVTTSTGEVCLGDQCS